MRGIKVISTKKLEDALIKRAAENNIEIVEKEFISVTPINTQVKYEEVLNWINIDKANVVITSANAANVLIDFLKFDDFYEVSEWKLFCMSGKTQETLLQYSNDINIAATAESSADLAKKIIEKNIKQVVFFCGDKRREELPGILTGKGIKVNEVVLYETRETPVKIEEKADGIIFYSPSGVNSFFSMNDLGDATKIFAIGNTTADALKEKTPSQIFVAEKPSTESVIEKVIKQFAEQRTKSTSE